MVNPPDKLGETDDVDARISANVQLAFEDGRYAMRTDALANSKSRSMCMGERL